MTPPLDQSKSLYISKCMFFACKATSRLSNWNWDQLGIDWYINQVHRSTSHGVVILPMLHHWSPSLCQPGLQLSGSQFSAKGWSTTMTWWLWASDFGIGCATLAPLIGDVWSFEVSGIQWLIGVIDGYWGLLQDDKVHLSTPKPRIYGIPIRPTSIPWDGLCLCIFHGSIKKDEVSQKMAVK